MDSMKYKKLIRKDVNLLQFLTINSAKVSQDKVKYI